MLAESRRQSVAELISSRGFATLSELVDALGVSESTIRRDLEHLENTGAVKRTHGGAVWSGELRAMPAFDDRTSARVLEKRAIARVAASLIEDGESVLLDGGTTTFELARALMGRPLQVVTNSLPIAHLMAASRETDLILIGGCVYPRTGVALGPLAIATMKDLKVSKAILGAGGVMPDGVYNSNLLLVETERAMMSCAQEVICVADSSKFGRQALTWLCGLDRLQRFVVDPGLPDFYRSLLERAGMEIHLAPAAPAPTPLSM